MKFDKNPQADGGKFLKLKDGDAVLGILRGEVRDFYQTWTDKVSTIVAEGTPKSKFRFRVNFVTMDNEGNLEPKILEQGPAMYKTLKELSQDYELENTVIKIKRTGSSIHDTEYAIFPLPKAPSDKTMKALETLQLLSLEDEGLAAPSLVDDIPF